MTYQIVWVPMHILTPFFEVWKPVLGKWDVGNACWRNFKGESSLLEFRVEIDEVLSYSTRFFFRQTPECTGVHFAQKHEQRSKT
jgi:hypothetical protein